jgi:hypothetical protein
MDELTLYNPVNEFIHADNSSIGIEDLSQMMDGCSVQAIKKIVVEALSMGKVKGNLAENGFLETVLKHTGNEFSTELITSLLSRRNEAKNSQYIIMLNDVIQSIINVKEKVVLNERQADLGELTNSDQLIHGNQSTVEKENNPQMTGTKEEEEQEL